MNQAPTSLATLREAREVDLQAVGRGAGDDELGLVLVGEPLHRVVVDLLGGGEPVADDLEPLAAHVERHAVGQVAAFGEAHAHDRVARLQQAEEHRLVGLRAGIRPARWRSSAPNSCLTRSIASCSTTSTNSQPP